MHLIVMVKRLRMFTFMLVWLVFPSVLFTDTSAQRKTKEGFLEMESEEKRSLSAMITYNSSERLLRDLTALMMVPAGRKERII